MIQLNVNGRDIQVDVDPGTPLLWAIREEVGLTGTKFGCGIAQCGACTVHLNGTAVRSCLFPTEAASGAQITTIEGLGNENALHGVQQAWLELDVPQCGYCQSGQIMAVAALLARTRNPSDEQIEDEITNICRCGTYPRIKAAIKRAIELT